MKRRSVQFTETARDHIRTALDWWREHRLGTDTLADEVEEAVKLLALLPGAGTPYEQSSVCGLRRVYMRRVSYHLYYTFGDEMVIIRALWHARRGGAPELE